MAWKTGYTTGSVLEHVFGPNEGSYLTTSYPHPIGQAKPNDNREIAYDGLPASFIRKVLKPMAESQYPQYLMNVMFWSSHSVEWKGRWKNRSPETSATYKDPAGCIWFSYSGSNRSAKFDRNWNREPSPLNADPGFHPELSELIRHLNDRQSGGISFVALGASNDSSPNCIFLRYSDRNDNWRYRWSPGALPLSCEMALQASVIGGKRIDSVPELSSESGEAKSTSESSEGPFDVNQSIKQRTNDSVWIDGRLRAITFGYGDSWILYGHRKFEWGGDMPEELEAGLEEGDYNNWSINKAVLNPRNPNEYVLAFNEDVKTKVAHVYFALHRDYCAEFQKIIKEWAEKKEVTFELHWNGVGLDSNQCKHHKPPVRERKFIKTLGSSDFRTNSEGNPTHHGNTNTLQHISMKSPNPPAYLSSYNNIPHEDAYGSPSTSSYANHQHHRPVNLAENRPISVASARHTASETCPLNHQPDKAILCHYCTGQSKPSCPLNHPPNKANLCNYCTSPKKSRFSLLKR